jgi:hypothetical protein
MASTATERTVSKPLLSVDRPGPLADRPDAWRAWLAERVNRRWVRYGVDAGRLAFSEAVDLWCALHPTQHSHMECAGCGELLSNGQRLALPDGATVHLGREFDCLIQYGRARRERAATVLVSYGIDKPPGWEA